MARHAEWNKFIQNLKMDKYGETNVNEVAIAFEKAIADVVPRSSETTKELIKSLRIAASKEEAELAVIMREAADLLEQLLELLHKSKELRKGK